MSHSDKAALRGEPGYVWRSGQDRRLAMIRQWVNLDGLVLDNGCGLGTYLAAVAPYSTHRFGLEIEFERAVKAVKQAEGVVQGVGERLPFAGNTFDTILSNEVIEHVANDHQYIAEMVRVLKKGGRIVLFCPNRWYPVEQHGIYWRGQYKFGNIPFVNYLPDSLRNRLAPHVRTYSWYTLQQLFASLPVTLIHHTCIFGGYDNITYRLPRLGNLIKHTLYTAERTPLQWFGLSHLLVLEKKAH